MSNKRITLDELHQCLVSDPYYGVWSAATESIFNSVYKDNFGDAVYEQFGNRFAQTSFNHDNQLHLICLWCGLMELPTYCDGKPTRWQGPDFIDNYQKSIEIELDEFKAHLKRYEWPLPVGLFHNEPDNTEERVKKDQQEEFQGGFNDGTLKVALEARREKWVQAPTESVADLDKQEKTVAEIDRQIDVIMHGPDSDLALDQTTSSKNTEPSKRAQRKAITSARNRRWLDRFNKLAHDNRKLSKEQIAKKIEKEPIADGHPGSTILRAVNQAKKS